MSALSAQVVIDVSLDTDSGKVNCRVNTYEGECCGINQLAEAASKAALNALQPPKGANDD